ncbi:Src homology-3 domain [Phaffia rhodozyma]|uniref:Src homology-3 domain n=1 Tax=Phaffia rhodozyma TaxID=264483 RepID=A0A0F7SLA8_PHARH|nr:Src homology-3 domain [Phaffia rhodozyma]
MDHRSPRSPHFPSPTSPFVPPPSEQDELDRLGAFDAKSTALHTRRSGGRPSDASSSSSVSAVSFPSSLAENVIIPSSSSSSPPPPSSSSLLLHLPSSEGSLATLEKDTDLDSPVESSLFLVTEPQEESHTDSSNHGDSNDPTGRNAALGLGPSAGQLSSLSHPSTSAPIIGLGHGPRSSPQPIIIPPLTNQAPGSPHPPQTEPHQSPPTQRKLQHNLQSDSHDIDPSATHPPSAVLLSSPPVKDPESHPIPSPTDAFSLSQSVHPPPSPRSSSVKDEEKPEEQTPAAFVPPPRTTDPDTSPLDNPSESPEIKIRDFAYNESNALHRKPIEPRANRASTADELEDGSQTEGRTDESRTKTAFGWGEFKRGEADEDWEDESDYDDDEDGDDQDEEEAHDGGNTGGGHGEDEEEEEDCTPGLYKALYAFQSEASSELSLSEGDLINVHRSGGIGWVIATLVSPNGNPVDPVQQGLVPRGYLRQVDKP